MAMAGMCCTLQAKANVQPVPQDSVHYESYMEKELMFQTAEPTYHKGVLVTSPWNGNWFVSLQGGASAFIGRPIGCADLFDQGTTIVSPHQSANGSLHRSGQESGMEVGGSRTATLLSMTIIISTPT